jgi:hypothetical protein
MIPDPGQTGQTFLRFADVGALILSIQVVNVSHCHFIETYKQHFRFTTHSMAGCQVNRYCQLAGLATSLKTTLVIAKLLEQMGSLG